MPSPKRNTTTQLSTLTTSLVEGGLVNGPTASLVLDSNIDFSTTGTASAPRIPIWIPAPVISAKSFPPESYAYWADTEAIFLRTAGGVFADGYDTPGSTAQAAYNAPPSVWLSWRGPTDGYTSEWLNHNPRYFLYYYTFNKSTYYSSTNPGRTYSPNRFKKWKHPLNFTYPTISGYPVVIANDIFNRTTEWPVGSTPSLISALNFSAGPTASWNDGFHPNQYMAGGGGATFFGSSNLFPIAVTGAGSPYGSPYSVWARDYGNMDVRRVQRLNQSPWQKRITLAFKFRIVIDHPQDPGRLMYGPYSETLLFRPEVGRFTVGATESIFYYKWGVKVK
jgi:hypothetical protein